MGEDATFAALVIGGSVGGLAAAHELRSIAADIKVYERSPGPTQARGAGVVMQPEVESLLNRIGISTHEICVELRERQHLDRSDGTSRYAAPQLMTAWDALYRALRGPLADVCYVQDSSLDGVRVEGGKVTACFANGHTAQGDFLVGADGIGSVTRRLLDPESRPAYAGYVAWRGLEPESALPDHLLDLLADRFTFFAAPGMQMLCYLVPGSGGERDEGARRVNWVWYINVAEPDLPNVMTGRTGKRFAFFLPPGELPESTHDRVVDQADALLPAPFAELVRLSTLFMQPVFDLAPRRMLADHAALIGDAAGTVRPHTASGTSKAFGDAAGLAQALQGWKPGVTLPAQALEQWEVQRLDRLVTLAESGVHLAARSNLGRGRAFFGPQ